LAGIYSVKGIARNLSLAETGPMEIDPAPVFVGLLALALFGILRSIEAGYHVISSKWFRSRQQRQSVP
jgi:hypothetical protein